MSEAGAFRVVVPARYGSTRLPAKALADLAGKPLVVRVWETAAKAGALETLVATDDARIAEAVERAGGQVVMTSPDHPTGTDRLAEVARVRGWNDDAIVVNLQGDEPFVPHTLPRLLASALEAHPTAGIATCATRIHELADVLAPHVVKVVLDHEGLARYFSRAPIPYARDFFASAEAARPAMPEGVPYLRHLGLYAYRARTLRVLSGAAQTPCERAESLEQLRALELGIAIHVSVLPEAPPSGIDTAEDLARARRALGA